LITTEKALLLIQDSFNSLQRSGVISDAVSISADTVILGSGTVLDSLGFVTFISDMEDRLSTETGQDIFLELDEIIDFSDTDVCLTAGLFATYIDRLTKGF
jgi:hypothetical protein